METQDEDTEKEIDDSGDESDIIELFEKTYKGVIYLVESDTDGDVYAIDSDDEVGEIVGVQKNGKIKLFNSKKSKK